MHELVFLVTMIAEVIFAAKCANDGDVAGTILYCFSAYCCLQFMKKGGGNDG